MKVHKITIMVIDHDGVGPDEAAAVLKAARYPNRCIYPHVMGVESRDIGEWSDSNPLNRASTMRDEFARIFGDGVGP